MVTDCEPDLLVLDSPGPETVHEPTPVAFHDMVEDPPPLGTLDGLAEIVADGARTSTEANAGAEFPPAPEHTT